MNGHVNRFAQQRYAQRASGRKAISAFWAKAERHRSEQLEAAKAILQDVAKYGGEAAAVVAWARLTIRNDAERKAAQ